MTNFGLYILGVRARIAILTYPLEPLEFTSNFGHEGIRKSHRGHQMAAYFTYVTENAKLFVSKFAKYLVLGVDFVQKP